MQLHFILTQIIHSLNAKIKINYLNFQHLYVRLE